MTNNLEATIAENRYLTFTSTDDKYKDVVSRVDLETLDITENSELSFEIEIVKPEDEAEKNKLLDDDEYTKQIFIYLRQMVKTMTNAYWQTATFNVLQDYEKRVKTYFDKYNYQLGEGESFIQKFADKGYYISEDDDGQLVAIKNENNKKYYFDKPRQMAFLKKEITGSGLILQ